MKLNHLDLQVSNIAEHINFFERAFALVCTSNRTSPAIAILTDGHGFTLVLQRNDKPVYPEGFHLGFIVDTEAEVHRMHTLLCTESIPTSAVQHNSRGTVLYCKSPDGIAVEVSVRKPHS